MKNGSIEDSALRSLFWKEEILQVMYWMHGEGMGSEIGLTQMLSFLNTSRENLEHHLHRVTEAGLLVTLEREGTTVYKLSETGKKEGGRQFAEAFQGMQKAGHGECGPDCEFCYGPDGVKLDNCVHNCASSSH
ncbi:ArsR/SmtB family transcription factor [Flagellimonas allohymeniacidonis]|uniref:Transcriptional regulator n=1 Tax=Flagellimonas allohymeniacidonis TaxID=2517819 RepID=A0A4Q8QHK9_9FLAO|nr:helix-turn-helix transcriptional regulator [Allomuricauda hymeniacidonis]TAI49267.1 transcriptional regulator [Allomuricauda hymeniacidonis]